MQRLALMFALVAPPTLAQSISWTASWEAALEHAKKEQKPIFIAINMDGERANDEMVRDVYKDPALVSLSQNTINLFCSKETHGSGGCTRVPGIACADHKKLEIEIRERYLHIPADEPVAAPQHLFLSPDGTLLSSVVFRISKGELEWMWIEAIKKANPNAKLQPVARARAPKAFVGGEKPADARGEKAPSKEEVDAALKEAKKSGGGGRGGGGGMMRNPEMLRLIARSPEKDARDFAENMLRSVPDDRKVAIIDNIGRTSPKEWWEVVAPYVSFRTIETRKAAIFALEHFAEPKSLPALTAQFPKETEPYLKGRILRAMAAVAPSNKAVVQSIVHEIKTQRDELVRAHAVVAVGQLEDHEAATAALNQALQDKADKVRGAAAYACAMRRDRELMPALDLVIKAEPSEPVLILLKASKAAIEAHAPLTPFAEFLQKELLDEKAR